MNFQQFDDFQKEIFAEVVSMAATKGKEYANDADRFANFNRLAQRLGVKREQILYVYLTKHLDSIESFVKNGQTFSNEGIRGRIVDAITYLTLLAGMIDETKT